MSYFEKNISFIKKMFKKIHHQMYTDLERARVSGVLKKMSAWEIYVQE